VLTYREPDGNEMENPSEDYLRDRVLGADLSYWEGPAGDAGLVRQGDGEDADLVLVVQAEGVLVRYRNFLAGDDRLVAEPPGDGADWVEVYDGQNTITVNGRFLVPREAAWNAVAEFVRTGRASPSLRWETQLEVRDGDGTA
jgi:hypothetical protein